MSGSPHGVRGAFHWPLLTDDPPQAATLVMIVIKNAIKLLGDRMIGAPLPFFHWRRGPTPAAFLRGSLASDKNRFLGSGWPQALFPFPLPSPTCPPTLPALHQVAVHQFLGEFDALVLHQLGVLLESTVQRHADFP